MSGYRLDKGGYIDRNTPLTFSFEGKQYSGFDGDTLASALIANGVSVIGRSFKYHRPRGILGAGLDEPNAIMQIESGPHTIPNLKATGIELYDGLQANPVNAWPSLAFDALSINSLLSRFIPAAFYYKTFMWPHWHVFEPTIRKAAGLGVSPNFPDPDRYEKRFVHCDVLVIGGGPAGLLAAQAASRSGARVIIVEYDPEWGGSLLNDPKEMDGTTSDTWIQKIVDELQEAPQTTVLNRTMAFGVYDHGLIGLVERVTDHLPVSSRSGVRQRIWKVRAAHTIIASGAMERPFVFPNNDRPGIMLASAGETYARRYAAAPGKRVVVVTNNDYGHYCAQSLQKMGVEIVAIADARLQKNTLLPGQIDLNNYPVFFGMTVTDTSGRHRVRSAQLHAIDDSGKAISGRSHNIDCDTILMSGGWSPVVHLFSQAGGKLVFDAKAQAFIPTSCEQNIVCVGAATGEYSLAKNLIDAAKAGSNAASKSGFKCGSMAVPSVEGSEASTVRAMWQVDVSAIGGSEQKAWVDFQNDVTASDVKLAIRENFQSVEHVKRYTTLGMASDQGKTSNVNGIGVMESVLKKPMAQVGTTKFRPPYDPTTIGAFAGRRVGENFAPLRALAAEQGHKEAGAKFDDYGGWKRPVCYLQGAETEAEAVQREAKAIRHGVGIFEASPLGKIEVFGPDAAKFLNRMYVNIMSTLKAGQCRYGIMLDENGVVFDDGVLGCLKENHFLVGTTSGKAAAIAEQFEEWLQCEWTDLDVVTDNVTSAWSIINVNGPNARDLLQKFDCTVDLSPDVFKHMQMREGRLAGVSCRIQRVSFSGELSYEVAIPWAYGASFWQALISEGAAFGVCPFGIEALMILRIEKGYLHVGSDTDGMTVPQDIGFGRILAKKKSDFVGRRSIMRPDAVRKNRRQFIGLENISDESPFRVGAHILPPGKVAPPAHTQGWVTSSVYSPNTGKPIALALVERGTERYGEEVQIWDLGESRRAKIVRPGVFDPEGRRLHV
ncbi:MAG: sarcosine oxidase subunit alpha [Robiginitomaculum sp.]|nr:MAG: sarcosine oxidase subunit alpha [Robiginitomaculum sp.]